MATMVKKANAFEILNHWVTAISFFVLAATGFAFLFQLEQMNAVFGNFNQMKIVHNYTGLVFTVSLFLSLFSYLPVALAVSGDDIEWLLKGGGYFSKKAVVPPQGKINTGQKGYYLFLVLTGSAISVSGFYIWLLPGIRKWILLSHLAHNIAFDLMLIAIPLHIYLATLANPGTLRIMLTGSVPLEWARKRHAKWIREMGL
jgi:formate dehydrogenase subunit gamma